ncbi:MAG: miaA, partial [Elusimicrobia bacterium]
LTGAEPAFRCLGYAEARAAARGEMPASEGLERMVTATNAYARRQRTWFKGQTQTAWLDPAGAAARAERLVAEAL